MNSALPGRRLGVILAALAVLLAIAGGLSVARYLLTRFMPWDDEGHMLLSLAHYIKDGQLYTRTFSQFGPAYFYAQGLFFQVLHLPETHDMGRLVTLIYWVASSLLAAVFVYRFSRSIFLACAAGLCCMLAGSVITNEPGHPEQLLLLLFMAAACLAAHPLSGRSYPHLLLLGAVGAAMSFTKINIGVFFIAGLAHTLVCLFPSGRVRSVGLGLTMIYAAAAPWLLMHATFHRGFRGYFILATASGIVTFARGAMLRPRSRIPVRAALWCGGGLLGGTGLIVMATSLQGMSLRTLVLGILLNPMHHPGLFFVAPGLSRFDLAACAILTVVVTCLRPAGRGLRGPRPLAALKCVVGIGAIPLALSHQIQWILPLLPLSLLSPPGSERDAAGHFPGLFITLMAVTQFLGTYPVAGNQLGIVACPMLLWAFLCIADGIAGLGESPRWFLGEFGKGLRLDAAIGVAILFAAAGSSISTAAGIPFPPASSGLRGSEWLHLPVEQAARFESISREVGANCGTLFTAPGMGSFNLWSGVPTPNGWNLGPWMKGFDAERQAEILDLMKRDSRTCAILNRDMVRFWGPDEAALAALPLAHYVMTDMPKVGDFGEYEVRVHPQRSAPWLRTP